MRNRPEELRRLVLFLHRICLERNKSALIQTFVAFTRTRTYSDIILSKDSRFYHMQLMCLLLSSWTLLPRPSKLDSCSIGKAIVAVRVGQTQTCRLTHSSAWAGVRIACNGCNEDPSLIAAKAIFFCLRKDCTKPLI